MPLVALYIGSAIFQFIAAGQSLAFVLTRRLGKVWFPVSLALLLEGFLSVWGATTLSGPELVPVLAHPFPLAELFVSLLFASGFVLTGQWFRFKERLEARFELIAEVDRSLVGVLDEAKIHSLVCGILSRQDGYRLAWVGAAEPDGTIRVEHTAGAASAFLAEEPQRWDDTPEGRTPAGTALRNGGMNVAKEGSGEPAAWRAACRRYGLRSCASVRIELQGFPHMVLSVYASTPTAFDALEAEAIAALATRLGNAIQSSRRHGIFVNAKTSYDELLRHQRDGVLLVREGRVVRANPAAADLLGFASPEQLVDADPASILADSDSIPRLGEALRGPQEEGERSAWEAPLLRQDGFVFTGEIHVTWVPRNNRKESFVPPRNGPLGMVLLRDVTQRVRVLHDLRKERDFSNKILDIAGALVLRVGPGGEILLFNRQCELVTGIAAVDALGRKMQDLLVAEPSRGLHRAAIEAVIAGDAPRSLETQIVTAQGEQRTIAWDHAPLRDSAGQTVSVIVTGIDVTERRMLEKQIIEMQKMEAVGTLAGGIAHDFNNILTGILGNLDIARRHVPAESQAALPIVECIRASERAAQLVRQLLDFSRRSPLERRAVDLSNVVREVVALFSQTIDRRIEITSSIAEDLLPAYVDHNQVHQVLMNLCVNARDAIVERMEADEASGNRPITGYWIYVRAENADVDDEYCRIFPYARKGQYIRLSIGDNGAGMDEATQRRVFEPFFTTKKMGRGTGLGLSTVYGIIKQHNGWINLESRPGKGTTFCAYFPETTAGETEGREAPEPSRPVSGKETILFVDDEELIRELGRQVLETHGYTVRLAEDGQRAIEMYTREKDAFDLVILDLTMPHRSGMEVLRAIRHLKPDVKVILSSGNMPSEPVDGTVFLPKPYRAETLVRTVRSAIDLGMTA